MHFERVEILDRAGRSVEGEKITEGVFQRLGTRGVQRNGTNELGALKRRPKALIPAVLSPADSGKVVYWEGQWPGTVRCGGGLYRARRTGG